VIYYLCDVYFICSGQYYILIHILKMPISSEVIRSSLIMVGHADKQPKNV